MARLTFKDFTLRQVYNKSIKYYLENDNKLTRAKLDIKRAKILRRHNLIYDPNTKTWKQDGRDIKIVCYVTSNPISYDRPEWDKNKKHFFPVTFLIHSLDSGFDSPFKWRTGSMKKPLFPKNGMSKEMKQTIAKRNITNKIQLQFFFELEYVLKKNNLLYGICWANRPPKITNPKNLVFMDKHAYFCFKKIIYPFMVSKKKVGLNYAVKNI